MRRYLSISILAALAFLGCDDTLSPPEGETTAFWKGRGRLLYTEGFSREERGIVGSINVDGTGQDTILLGAMPCRPQLGKMLYTYTSGGSAWTIFTASVQGGASVPLATKSYPNLPLFGVVDFSADARRAVYGLYNVLNGGKSSLYVVATDGSEDRSLDDGILLNTFPAFSPDGEKVAYYAEKNELRVAEIATGAVTVIARNAKPWTVENLEWSPDGLLIAYTGTEDPAKQGGRRDIFLVRPDGSGLRNITREGIDDSRWPTWSPGGSQLAFIKGQEIWTMNADGSAPRQITSISPWPYQIKMYPEWSPDGTMIAFTAAGNAGQGLLQVVDLKTLRVNALVNRVFRAFWL